MKNLPQNIEKFDTIFQDLHRKMKEVDPYYEKYSSYVEFAGSHYDNLRIKTPNKFDMDIVIDLPPDMKANCANSGVIIEPITAGYLQLRMGMQFQSLQKDENECLINKTAFEWQDSSNYLSNSNIMRWFRGVVVSALKKYPQRGHVSIYNVNGVPYRIYLRDGKAVTLSIYNTLLELQMDVDLVPAIKIPEERWPIGKLYRHIPPNCSKGYWMVVPKPNQSAAAKQDIERTWRIALHNQERQLICNSFNLRQAIRLIERLRDAQEMTKITNYYIKTLVLWETYNERTNEHFWRLSTQFQLFKLMVQLLHEALLSGNIPYFWNGQFNLIGNVHRSVLDTYIMKLVPIIDILNQPSKYKFIAQFLLNREEFEQYRKILNI